MHSINSKIIILLFVLIVNQLLVHAQNDSIKHQVDFVDVAEWALKHKFRTQADSEKVKPGKLLFAIVPGLGYSLQTNFDVVVTANISFYTGSKQTTNLSAIQVIPEYAPINKMLIVPIAYDIWAKDNKFDWMGDVRFYQYPSYTYGLGSTSSLSNADLINYSYIRCYQELLKHINSNLYAGFGYDLDYHWNIQEEGGGTEFQLYNQNATKTISSGLVANVVYDDRPNVNNCLGGNYLNIAYRLNTTLLGSDQNWQSLQLEYRKFIRPVKKSTNVIAFWAWEYFTFDGKAPYFDLPSTSWDTYSNTGRGYIQGRLRGPDMLYAESEYRFAILKNGLLGGVVFLNAETVSSWPDSKLQFTSILPGYGVGLRIKVNKFSNVNFAIDYGFGTQGSQGFFLNIAEIF